MLRGWGMLSWVQGEGKRVGETPPDRPNLLRLETHNLTGTVGVETCGMTGVKVIGLPTAGARLLAADVELSVM